MKFRSRRAAAVTTGQLGFRDPLEERKLKTSEGLTADSGWVLAVTRKGRPRSKPTLGLEVLRVSDAQVTTLHVLQLVLNRSDSTDDLRLHELPIQFGIVPLCCTA